MCQFILGNHIEVLQLLIDTLRLPEAAFYARTYCPSQISRVVDLWKQSLIKIGKSKMANAIADPVKYEDLFPDYQISLDMEKVLGGIKNAGMPPAAAYNAYAVFDNVDVIKGIVVFDLEIKGGKKIADIFGPLIAAGQAGRSRPPSPERVARPNSPIKETVKEAVKVEKQKEKVVPEIMSRGKSASPTKTENRAPPSGETSPGKITGTPTPIVSPPVTSIPPVAKISKPDLLSKTSPAKQDEAPATAISPKKHTEPKLSFVKPSGSVASSNGSSLNGVTNGNGKHGPSSPAREVSQPPQVTQDPWETKEFISDNASSHMSMEVNTTGTGSVRGLDPDFDDFEMDNSAPPDFDASAMDDEELEKMLM